MKKRIALLFFVTMLLGSCVAVKEYEKVNINDPDMVLATKKVDRFETNFQAYREAASGANGGKTGGGCGCN
jgi:PBP1b-binding outer membrane lipoprotein LpoB